MPALLIKVKMMMALGVCEGCPTRDVQELLDQDQADENINKCIDDGHHLLHGFHVIGTWQAISWLSVIPTGALYVIMCHNSPIPFFHFHSAYSQQSLL